MLRTLCNGKLEMFVSADCGGVFQTVILWFNDTVFLVFNPPINFAITMVKSSNAEGV
jgi:hypothetical protein